MSSKYILKINDDGTSVMLLDNKKIKFNKAGTRVIHALLKEAELGDIVDINKLSESTGVASEYLEDFINKLISLGVLEGVRNGTQFILLSSPKHRIHLLQENRLPSVEWLITSRCQCRCVYCIYENYKIYDKKELSTKESLSLIDQMAELGVLNVTLSGGEPLLRRDILSLIEALYDYDINIRLDTNGILLTEDTIKKISRYQDNIKISISLDSVMPELNDKIRGCPGGTKRIIKNIQQAKKFNLYLNISTVLTKMNYYSENIISMYNFLTQVGVEKWTLAFVRPFGKAKENWDFIKVFIREEPDLAATILDLAKKSKIPKIDFVLSYENIINFFNNQESIHKILTSIDSNIDNIMSLKVCEHCRDGGFLHITPWGDVFTCLFLPQNISKIGNLRHASLKELWEKSKNDTLIHNRYLSDFLPNCTKCKYVSLCKGGCRANALALQGDLKGCDPIAKDKIEFLLSIKSKMK